MTTVTFEKPAPALTPEYPPDGSGSHQDASAPEVTGADVLDEARAFLARFWVPPDTSALDIMALWAAASHVTDKDGVLAFYSTPRIAFVSDEPASGKSAALELLELLCPRAERLTDPTAPAMLELIAQHRATLLVDEVDLLFGSGNSAKAVRAVINSGYRRGAKVARVKGPQDTFAPVALAGLASSFMANPVLEPTRSRCIIVHCRRPSPGVRPERYREQLHAGLGALAGRSLAQWAAANVMTIATQSPEMPEGLDGRQEDIWQPVISVADVAGGRWPGAARAACRQYTAGGQAAAEPEMPPRMRLLAGIRAVWPDGADRMSSKALMEALCALPGAPWSVIWTPFQMLSEVPAMLGIEPVKVRVDGKPVQGYYRHQVAAAWRPFRTFRHGEMR